MVALDLRSQTIRALHLLRDREKALERIAALPGVGRGQAIDEIDAVMAANRRANRFEGVKIALIGSGVIASAGLVMVLAWCEIEAIQRIHLILVVMIIVIPFIGMLIVAYGISVMRSPSPFDNLPFAKRELNAIHAGRNQQYIGSEDSNAPMTMTMSEPTAHGAPTSRVEDVMP